MKNFPSRRDKMIMTAIEIIDELGIKGLSAQELATRGEMAPSLIYRYFKSMDEVVLSVIENYSKYDNAILKSVSSKNSSPKERILDYFKSYIELYENYPQLTSIVNIYESLKHEELARTKVESIEENRIQGLKSLLEGPGKELSFNIQFSDYEFSLILWGYVTKKILIWRMKKFAFPLKEEVMDTLKGLIDSYPGI